MSFPFLHALNAAHPEDEIIVVCKPEHRSLFTLLPFTVTTATFSKDDYPGLLGIYRFCGAAQIADVDRYFSLPRSFSSAWMGRCFAAKERIGHRGQLRGLLLTNKRTRPRNRHRVEEYLDLLEGFRPPGEVVRNLPRRLEPVVTDGLERPYLVIHADAQVPSRRLPDAQWLALLDRFTHQTFVFVGDRAAIPRIQALVDRLAGGNAIVNLVGKTSPFELARIIAHSQGIIANDSGPAHLASYLGVKVMVFFGAGDASNTRPYFYPDRSLVIEASLSCSPCLAKTCPLGTLACLTSLDMASVSRQAHAFFGLSD